MALPIYLNHEFDSQYATELEPYRAIAEATQEVRAFAVHAVAGYVKTEALRDRFAAQYIRFRDLIEEDPATLDLFRPSFATAFMAVHGLETAVKRFGEDGAFIEQYGLQAVQNAVDVAASFIPSSVAGDALVYVQQHQRPQS